MSTDGQQSRPEFALVDERELRVMLGMPFGMLLLATGPSLADNAGSTVKVLTDLGLAGATAGWMVLLYALRPRWRKQQGLTAATFAVLIALMAALVLRNPLFGFFTWTGYIWASLTIAVRWRLLAYAPVAIVTGTSQHGGLPTHSATSWISWIAFIGINMFAAGAVAWFARTREEEHIRRKQTIAELTEANAKLEASMRENAGLHAQLLAQAREAGVLDERQRMAGEIHDTLAQGLVGIITQLEAAAQAPGPAESHRHTTAAAELARESLAEARRSVQALRPIPLEEARLPDALATVARRWSERTRVTVSVTTTGRPRPVAPEVEQALLRTAQEALANVAKHAQAGRVGLTLSYMDDVVALDVRDDGVGFAQAAAPSLRNGGFGLTAMRQRVEGLAGSLEVESEPGAGTTVAATIPAGSRV